MRIKLLSVDPTQEYSLYVKDKPEKMSLHIVQDAFYINGLLLTNDIFVTQPKSISYFMQTCLHRYKPLDTLPVIHLQGETLLMSNFGTRNYSHFTLQALPTYLLAKKFDILKPYTNLFIDQTNIPLKTLEFLNVRNQPVIPANRGILFHFDTLIYSDSIFPHYNFIDPEVFTIFENISSTLHNNNESIKLYISRLHQPHRRMVNEKEIISFLQDQGFIIKDFEDISVQEQISLINSASIICAPHGASGANLAYRSKKKFKFIEIFSEGRITQVHAQILLNKNCDYVGVVGSFQNKHAQNQKDDPYYVDITLLDQALNSVCHTFKYPVNFNQNEILTIYDRNMRKKIINETNANPKHSYNKFCNFIDEANLYLYSLRQSRRFTGQYCHANKTSGYIQGWGASFVKNDNKKPRGFAFTLSELKQCKNFTLFIYHITKNEKQIDLSNLSLCFKHHFTISELSIFDDCQEVYFPAPALKLPFSGCYLVYIEADGLLGAGFSLTDLPDDLYLFRGYYKTTKNKNLFSISANNSLAWRPIY